MRRDFCSVALCITIPMQLCTQWTNCVMWSQLAKKPECMYKLGDQRSEKKQQMATGGRYTTRFVVLTPCWESSSTGVSLMSVPERLHSDGAIPPGQQCFLLMKMLQPMLYHSRDCAHHQARFVIFAHLSQLRIFFITILVFPRLPIVETCKIAHTITNGVHYLLICCFRLCGCQSRLFSISQIFLFPLNCCLHIVNLHSCHSGCSVHTMIDHFLLLFVLSKVCFSSLPHRNVHFGSHAAQCSKRAERSCCEVALGFIRLMILSFEAVYRFAIITCRSG